MTLAVPDPPPAPPASDAPSRETAFDAYKGIAILAVILHHVSGLGLRNTVPGSASHLAAVFLNRSLLFCVPAFLFLTVFLLGRSLLRRPMPPRQFWAKRFPRILVPYLFWTVFYVLYNVINGPGSLHDLTDPNRWVNWLLLGKANYHLYFMVIVLQIYLVLPGLMGAVQGQGTAARWRVGGMFLLLSLAAAGCLAAAGTPGLHAVGDAAVKLTRWAGWAALAGAMYLVLEIACARGVKRLPGLGVWALVAFTLQAGAFYLHKVAIRSPYPATLLLSYLLPLLLGIWSALHWDRFRQGGRTYRWTLGLLTLATLAVFMPLALRMVDGRPVNPFLYQITYSAFTSSALMWLFALTLGLSEAWPKLCGLLAVPGAYSMELYLLHPAVLTQITRHPFQGSPVELFLYISVLFVDLTALSLLVAILLRKGGLGGLLFGR